MHSSEAWACLLLTLQACLPFPCGSVGVLRQVSFVGHTEEAAREAAQKGGFADKLAVTKTSFKANSKVQILSQSCSWPVKTSRTQQMRKQVSFAGT